MDEDVAYVIAFYDADDYRYGEDPDRIYHISVENTSVPAPRIGETVAFEWLEKDGERVWSTHITRDYEDESVQSQEYEVVDVKRQYYQIQHHDSSEMPVMDTVESKVDVLVKPV